MAIEPILAHGTVLDKGAAMFLVAKCQIASAASYSPQKKAEGKGDLSSVVPLPGSMLSPIQFLCTTTVPVSLCWA